MAIGSVGKGEVRSVSTQVSGIPSPVDASKVETLIGGGHPGRGAGSGLLRFGISVRYPNKVVNRKLDNGSEDKDLKVISL